MKTCYVTVKDQVWMYITGLHGDHNDFLWKKFGIYKDGYIWSPQYKLGRWDGKIRFFDKSGKTYVRLLDKILPFLEEWEYNIVLKDESKILPAPEVGGNITSFDSNGLALTADKLDIFPNNTVSLRPYQLQAIKTAVEHGSGFAISGTGSGKSVITAGISHVYSQVGYKTITVVPSGDLVNQTYDWYKLAGLDTGIYSGETKDLNHSNVVATWQSLQYNPSIIEDFNVFIWDECVHPDTLITTAHGKIAIKDLKVGDFVLTIDEQDNRITAFKPIRKIFKNLYHSHSEKRYKLFFEEGGELIITGNHKVLTQNGWKRADNLVEGDIAHTSRIISIKEIDYIGDTYNLHVEDNHNYFANGIVVSNCHGAAAEVARKLINEHGRNIQFRFGVTGTFPKSEVDQYNLFSSIGSIFIEIPAKWLIDHGYLAKITIEPVEVQESNIEENFIDYAAEKSFLSKSLPRLEAIADLVISKCIQHGNTLVLVNSIQFGKKLSALIKDSVFLYGESSTDLRKEHYDMFETRNDVIVIASAGIASTGISIDRIFCMMLVDPGKSFVKAIQSAGRGLRKAKDKHEVVLIDVYSNLKWARKHHRDRLKYYKEANYPVLAKQTLKLKNRH